MLLVFCLLFDSLFGELFELLLNDNEELDVDDEQFDKEDEDDDD